MNTCENCGKETKRKYCSYACYWDKLRKISTFEFIERTCQFCEGVFQIPKYRSDYGYGKYCSVECKNKGISQASSQNKNATCQRCGKKFHSVKSRIKKGQDKYCSKACYTPPLIKKCLTCGKEFRTSPSAGREYCSKTCACNSQVRSQRISAAQKTLHKNNEFKEKFLSWIKKRTASDTWKNSKHFQKGAAHPAYKGNASARESAMGHYDYKKWRKDVFARDNYTCQDCQVKGGYLHAHHIKEWAKFPALRFDVSNGITLCVPCHKKRHAKK